MTEIGQERRTYRQQQAQATRDRIAEAARRLFAADGYRMTTMAAIADEAGVAPRTVYSAFGAKREILSAICEKWLEDAHARQIIEAALAESDPARTVAHAARFLRSLFETGFDVARLFDAAAAEDPETRAMLRAKLDGRNGAMDQIVASVEGALRLPLAQAQSIYRAYATSGIYQELVADSGWSNDEYETWIEDQLSRQLLGRTRRTSRSGR